MKRFLFLILIFSGTIFNSGNAQITIHPEVGGSYFPFILDVGPTKQASRRVDFLFGVSGYFPINEKLTAQTRISFTGREDIRFIWGRTSDPKYRYSDYIRSELNLDFRLNVFLKEYLDFGVGTSIIRTFAEIKDTFFNVDNTGYHYSYYGENKYSSGVSVGLNAKFDRLRFHLSYLRILGFKEIFINTTGSNRLDLTISYHLLGGDKRKR